MDNARYRVWCRPGLTYYPVRKAASSSLQLAFGGEPVDMRRVPDGVLRFTMVRNPFDRLASLYANNLDYPFMTPDVHKGMPLQTFVDQVCITREPYCDQHFWSADWTTPFGTKIYYFEDIHSEIARMNFELGLNFTVPHIGKSKSAKPLFSHSQQAQIAKRYAKDLARFYEDDRSQQGSRARGQAAAKVRQESLERTKRKYSIGGGPPSTNSPPD